jgi:hypothetical protein
VFQLNEQDLPARIMEAYLEDAMIKKGKDIVKKYPKYVRVETLQ